MCIALCFFNDLLLATYFICILAYGNDVRQKSNLNGFLFKFKISHKSAETALNISNAFGPRTVNEHIVQWWFKNFCQVDKSLEDEKLSGWPLKADSDQLRGLLKLILLKLYKKLPKNSTSTILWLFGIWNKLERWKSSISGCFMRWLQVKKKPSFWSVVFSYSNVTTTNHFSIRLWHAMESGS